MITKYDVYEAEGELLDAAYLAAINERPFRFQNELDDLTLQVRLLDHITPEAQADYFAESVRQTADNVEVRVNPALNAGARYDFTPIPPDMPVIDMDTIEEIEL